MIDTIVVIKTNADMIREMDDETLAEYLSMLEDDIYRQHDKPSTYLQWLEYLQEEVDDEYEGEDTDGISKSE